MKIKYHLFYLQSTGNTEKKEKSIYKKISGIKQIYNIKKYIRKKNIRNKKIYTIKNIRKRKREMLQTNSTQFPYSSALISFSLPPQASLKRQETGSFVKTTHLLSIMLSLNRERLKSYQSIHFPLSIILI